MGRNAMEGSAFCWLSVELMSSLGVLHARVIGRWFSLAWVMLSQAIQTSDLFVVRLQALDVPVLCQPYGRYRYWCSHQLANRRSHAHFRNSPASRPGQRCQSCYVYVVYCRARANGGVKEPRIGSQFKMLACSHLCSHCIGVMFGRGAKASHSSIGRCQRM
jgi:hypothetical protein